MISQDVDQFEKALLSFDRLAAENILNKSDGDRTPIQFIEELIVPALERLGTGWEEGRVALSQIYMSGRICEKLVNDILSPCVQKRTDQPRMAIGVLEDYHLLGKRIVYSALRASGFELLDYGQITVDELVRRIKEERIKVLLISVLMLPSALLVKKVREKLKETGTEVKIVVGGAPFRFDNNLWKEVEADAMGNNASEAVQIITKIMEEL
ncbi:cobalamin-dependent protein [Desulfobacterales bacterium HSG16]|nr:cobalamin-dependent protein [Desulfobacterales bacterium HSG16]